MILEKTVYRFPNDYKSLENNLTVSTSKINYIYYKMMPSKLSDRSTKRRSPEAHFAFIMQVFFYFGDYKIFPDKISLVTNLGI